MTPQEQTAFIDTYMMFVGDADRNTVAEFVRKYNAGEIMHKTQHYVSILDALGMWYGATKYQIQQEQST